MNRTIAYGIEKDTGLVYSRVGDECAGPVLDYQAIGQGDDGYEPGDFRGPIRYTMEKMPLREVYPYVVWTKKIPVPLKNRHREFWGFPLLKEAS
jgi:hypothetical protein